MREVSSINGSQAGPQFQGWDSLTGGSSVGNAAGIEVVPQFCWRGVSRSFETPASQAPQDDVFLNAIENMRHPEERPKDASRRTHDGRCKSNSTLEGKRWSVSITCRCRW